MGLACATTFNAFQPFIDYPMVHLTTVTKSTNIGNVWANIQGFKDERVLETEPRLRTNCSLGRLIFLSHRAMGSQMTDIWSHLDIAA